MPQLIKVTRRHPLITFFALAYGLSWWPSLIDPHSILPLGPLAAAVMVLAVTGGWPAVRRFFRAILAWRVALPWYLFVLGLPAALAAAAAAMNPLFGAALPALDRMAPFGELLPTFGLLFLFIGLGEEPAWRGFALPALARERSMLAAALMLAAFHAIWHLPLFGLEYTADNAAPWLLSLTAFSVLTAWLYTRTAGNLLLPALFHASVNTSARYVFPSLYTGDDLIRLHWIWAALWCAAALVPAVRLWSAGRARDAWDTPPDRQRTAG